MESLLKNLKEHVTCSICLDTYTKPKTIACLHTFCCACLERHALMRQKQGLYPCPECQAQIRIPEGNGFDNLPSSFLHNSLLSLLAVRRSGEGNEISCSTCQKNSAEINYCFDCEKFICPDCVKAHDVFRNTMFEGHKVTPVRQFEAADYEALLKRQSFCSEKYHKKDVIRFFCVDCQRCVCPACIATNHKGHDVVLIENAADDEKAKILARTEQVREKKMVCRDVIREFENTEVELEANITTAKGKVSQAVEQMIRKLKQLEVEAITALEEARVSRIEKFLSGKASVVSLEKQLEQAVEFSNNLVERSSSSDIMQNKKSVEERIEDLIKTTVPVLPVNSFVEFVSTCEPESLSLGSMNFSETKVWESTVEGLDQNFQAGVEAELLICPKSSEGEIRNTQCTDHVEVHIDPADQVRSLVTSEKEDGHFLVKIMAKVPGVCKMEVKINGLKLAKSPFSLPVKAREFNVIGKLDFQGELSQGPTGIAVNKSLSLGFTKFCETDVPASTVEGLDQNFQAGVEAELLIFPKSSEGETKDSQHTDRVEVHIEPADRVSNLLMSEKEDDSFIVKFVAKVPGTYEMEVKINGQELEFLIPVKARQLHFAGKLDFQGAVSPGTAGVAVNSKGVIAVAGCKGHCILVFDEAGKFVRKPGCHGDQDGQFNRPIDVTFINDDEILVGDNCNHRIQRLNVQTGNFVKKFGKEGNGDGELKNPASVCITSDGRFIVVAEFVNSRIQVFTMDGEPVLKFGDSGSERLDHPVGCICYEDNFIVTDKNNNCVKEKGNGDGRLDWPCGLSVDKCGNVFLCDRLNNRIQQFTLEGTFIGKTSTDLKLEQPWGITTISDDRILITEFDGKEVIILK
ncbi:E3 ubiquitin-protein ligase TRIM71-like [Stylophora pistillata]|uniref:E3 ubiquitin-protein ligase TRIM71-like n=1 Tax=Stylophora pistillata TaxID=50429 RepID=UPI000C055DA0|nr:E3 ubiquitin-protein ligase TRIM71-like [Stylophora pistillata]